MKAVKEMTVEQMKSPISNAGVANQFKIREGNNKVVFQSYQSTIAIIERLEDGQHLTLGADWDYSRTTMRWLGQFLDEEFIPNMAMRELLGKRVGIRKADLQKLLDAGLVDYREDLHNENI